MIRPANNDFAQAQVISGPGPVSGTTENATVEDGERNRGGGTPANTVWYRWTAPSNGVASFSLCGEPADGPRFVAAPFTGSQVDALAEVPADLPDECPPSRLRRGFVGDFGKLFSFNAAANATYFIQVDSFSGTGDFTAQFGFVSTDPAVDRTAPKTTITKGPKKRSKKRKARFEFVADEAGVSFECSLNGGQFRECASPAKVRGRRGERNVFAVRATDAAGNVEDDPVKYRWKIKRRR